MSESVCRGCGKKIIWITVKKPDGTDTKVCLDPAAAVYEVDPTNPTIGERTKTALVSHFATCKDANQFSGSQRR